jgi:hypothetical protein
MTADGQTNIAKEMGAFFLATFRWERAKEEAEVAVPSAEFPLLIYCTFLSKNSTETMVRVVITENEIFR